MKKTFLSFLVLGFIGLQAQKTKTPKPADPKPFAASISADDLRKHLFVVAGAEMEGRETASEGQRKAAAYIEQQFKNLGLAPGNKGAFQMPYPVFQDSLVNASIEVNGKRFEFSQDFSLNLGSSNTTSLMASEVVFVGSGRSDSAKNDYANLNVKGKLVLVMQGNAAPSGPAQGRGFRGNPQAALQEAAAKNGASAILVIQPNFQKRPAVAKGMPYTTAFRKVNLPNVFTISEAVAEAIIGNDLQAVKSGTASPKSYDTEVLVELNKVTRRMESSNVIGFLEGTDLKDEFLVLSAHYDHLGKRENGVIYFGADDDGSGTVSVLELAEAFVKAKAAGKGPRRSVVFLTVSGEEKGLWGSNYYSEHPAFPLDKTTADLNIDMIGRIDPKRTNGDSTNYVYVVGDDKLSSDLKPISEAINKKYIGLELDYKYNDPKDQERIYFRSDHFNFARKGVPIIFYFNGTHNDYHKPSDTPDKINYDLMAKRAQLVFYTAWEMANRNEMLKRDIPLETMFK